MKNLWAYFSLIFINLVESRKKLGRFYEICMKIIDTPGIKSNYKISAFLYIATIVERISDHKLDEFVQRVNQIIDNSDENLTLNNSEFFNLSVSIAYYEKIGRSIDEHKDTALISRYLEIADKHFLKSEKMSPNLSELVYAMLLRLNVYLNLERYQEIIKICHKYLEQYKKICSREQLDMILFHKAKSYAKLNELQIAYDIYQSIKTRFSKNDDMGQYVLFHIFHDTGRYHEKNEEYEKSLESYQRSLIFLNELDNDYQSQMAPNILERIKSIENQLGDE
ncbi:MAG TPA: hypothetical protein VFT51_13260 [Bacillales bacterium]|nr:hypothetical protein [Bacillales bacterium]